MPCGLGIESGTAYLRRNMQEPSEILRKVHAGGGGGGGGGGMFQPDNYRKTDSRPCNQDLHVATKAPNKCSPESVEQFHRDSSNRYWHSMMQARAPLARLSRIVGSF